MNCKVRLPSTLTFEQAKLVHQRLTAANPTMQYVMKVNLSDPKNLTLNIELQNPGPHFTSERLAYYVNQELDVLKLPHAEPANKKAERS